MCIYNAAPKSGLPADPVEDLIPAGLELSVVEAGESAFEYGLKASQLNRGSVKARRQLRATDMLTLAPSGGKATRSMGGVEGRAAPSQPGWSGRSARPARESVADQTGLQRKPSQESTATTTTTRPMM